MQTMKLQKLRPNRDGKVKVIRLNYVKLGDEPKCRNEGSKYLDQES